MKVCLWNILFISVKLKLSSNCISHISTKYESRYQINKSGELCKNDDIMPHFEG